VRITTDWLVNLDLTEEQLLLCNSTHVGYSFSQKKPREFDVEHIQDIEWDTNAFSSLVLSKDVKDVLLSLVDVQTSRLYEGKDDFDDVISGKGQGYIMLLSGSPGVGKTLTAESGESIM
jgi:predicted ATP-dependent serine protease